MTLDPYVAERAVALGLATPDEIRRWLTPDPFDGLDVEGRARYFVEHAASGVWAECPPAVVTVNGRPIPAPVGYRPHRGPRGRSPRGRRVEPPVRTAEPAQPVCASLPGADESPAP